MAFARRPSASMAVRFYVLIVASSSVAITIAETVWYHVRLDQERDWREGCAALVRVAGTEVDSRTRTMDCLRQHDHARVLWTVGWGIAIVIAAGIAGAIGSAMRRATTIPVPATPLPAVVSINNAVAGSDAPLELRWSPKRHVGSARADGITHPYIEVSPRLLALATSDPDRFAAILEHEYSHHRAHDILASRWTQWSIFTLAPPVAVLGFLLLDEGWDEGVLPTLRVLAGVLIVLCARAATLRTREFAADSTAVTRGRGPALDRALGAGLSPRRQMPQDAIRRLLATHPDRSRRQQFVRDPTLLDRLSPLDGAIVGATAALAAPVLTRLIRTWAQTGDPSFYADWIAWSGVGAGLSAWVVAVIYSARGSGERDTAALTKFAGAMSAGVLLGQWLFSQPIQLGVRPLPRSLLEIVGIFSVPLVIICLVFWIESVLSASPRRISSLACLILCATVSTIVIGAVAQFANDTFVLAATGDSGVRPLSPNSPFDVLQFIFVNLSDRASLGFGATFIAVYALMASRISFWRGLRHARSAFWIVISGVFGAAATSGLVWWLVIDVYDLAERVEGRGWFAHVAAAQGSKVLVALPGFLMALAFSASATRHYVARTLALSAATSPAAGAAVSLIDWAQTGQSPGLDRWFELTANLLAVTLAAVAIVAILAIMTRRVRSRLSRMFEWALALATVFALVLLVLFGAPVATPTAEAERAHFAQLIPPERLGPTLTGTCISVTIDSAQVPIIASLADDVRRPESAATRLEFRVAHELLGDMLAYCDEVTRSTLSSGSQVVALAEQDAALDRLCAFQRAGEPLRLRLAELLAEACI